MQQNDETTEIVKNIYALYIQGWGLSKIASFLNSKEIKPPSSFIENFTKSKFGKWTSNSIKYILTNPKYAGIMVQGRWKKVSYKIKKITSTPQEQWIYGEEFEGIISREIFEEVQEIISKNRKKLRYKNNKIHLFSGVLQCKECGGSMCYRNNYKGYKCTNSQIGGKRCTAHSVKEDFLKDIIKDDLSKYISKLNINEFYEEFIKVKNGQYDYKKLQSLEYRLKKISEKIGQLYSDKVNGTLSERNFYFTLKEAQKEQEKLEIEKSNIERKLKENSIESNYNKEKNKINDILSFENLDRNAIETLIEKIIISYNKDTREKSVEIFYKFSIKDL